jgi:chaperonin GroES
VVTAGSCGNPHSTVEQETLLTGSQHKSLEEWVMDIRPLYDRIVVKRVEEAEAKSAGGLIIPDSAKEKPQQGEVVAAGNGKKTEDGKVIPLDVKVGDKILFGKYSGSDIKIGTEEYLIMREDEVLAILTA